MLKKAILFGILGLIIGYFIFGRVNGDYISIKQLINPPQNFIKNIAESITGVKDIRKNILITGAAGAGIGILLGIFKK